jgi:hypothetical protein
MIQFKKIDFKSYNDIWELEQKMEMKKIIVDSFMSYGELHNYIKSTTKSIPQSDEELFKIILLIQKWGGTTGRYFLIIRKGESYFDKLKNNESLIKLYREAAKSAMNGDPKSFDLFCGIPGIKESFAGKHAYFWSNPKNPLIIIDKLLAQYFGFENPNLLLKSCNGYSNLYDIFSKEYKANNLSSILTLERGIFQYVRESNKKKK